MENRKIVSTPVSDERPLKVKRDDFEPPLNSGGPPVDDKPVPPPGSYDGDTALPGPPSDAAGK